MPDIGASVRGLAFSGIAAALAAVLFVILVPSVMGQAPEGERDDSRVPRAPGTPRNLSFTKVLNSPSQLPLSFTRGVGSTIHEFELYRSATSTVTDQSHRVVSELLGHTSPQNLGKQDRGYWYRARVNQG